MRAGLILLAYLIGAARGCPRSPARRSATVHIAIEGIAFQQLDVQAHVGDTVEWTNKDVIAHTATTRSTGWDLPINPGNTAHVVLTRAGTFEYYCRFHPNMT